MPITRSSVVGTISGVVVLGGFVAFAVGLPKLTGDDAAAAPTSADRPAVADVLPDTLLGNRLVRFARVDQNFLTVRGALDGLAAGQQRLVDLLTAPRDEDRPT